MTPDNDFAILQYTKVFKPSSCIFLSKTGKILFIGYKELKEVREDFFHNCFRFYLRGLNAYYYDKIPFEVKNINNKILGDLFFLVVTKLLNTSIRKLISRSEIF